MPLWKAHGGAGVPCRLTVGRRASRSPPCVWRVPISWGVHVVFREGFRVRRAASFVCAVVLASMLAACTSSDDEPARDPVGTKDDPVKLSFMTYGPEEEVEAYESIVQQFNETHEGVSP